jgi:hypothetical protein
MQERLAAMTQNFAITNQRVLDLTTELAQASDELDFVKVNPSILALSTVANG